MIKLTDFGRVRKAHHPPTTPAPWNNLLIIADCLSPLTLKHLNDPIAMTISLRSIASFRIYGKRNSNGSTRNGRRKQLKAEIVPSEMTTPNLICRWQLNL